MLTTTTTTTTAPAATTAPAHSKSRSGRRTTVKAHSPAAATRALEPSASEITGRELNTLLDDISPATFFNEYWERKPLVVKGSPAKLQRLLAGGFGRADFYRAVRQAAARQIEGFKLWGGKHQTLKRDNQTHARPLAPIHPDDMEKLFAEGLNIMAGHICDERLSLFCAALKTQLRRAGGVHIYATLSPQDDGVAAHIDKTDAVFIQCEGKKRYLISPEPILRYPNGTATISQEGSGVYFDHEAEPWEEIAGVDMANFIEVVLEPGDTLIIPAGTVHATTAVDGSCLNLCLVFSHQNFLDLITRHLHSTLFSQPEWRHIPAGNPASAEPGALPAELQEFFAARLAELRALFDTLTPDALALNGEWHKMLAHPGEATLAALPPRSGAATTAQPITRKDVLRLSQKAPLVYATGTDADGDASLSLYFGDKEAGVGGEWVPFLQKMMETKQFTAGAATKWAGQGSRYPWATVQAYLQVLLEQGVLERSVS